VSASTHFLTESSTCWREASAILKCGCWSWCATVLCESEREEEKTERKGVPTAKARWFCANHFQPGSESGFLKNNVCSFSNRDYAEELCICFGAEGVKGMDPPTTSS
jgi:hypothetical protein